MPNWTSNILEMENIIHEDLFTDDNFDFNKILAMPKELDISESSISDIAIDVYLSMVNPKNEYMGRSKLNQQGYDLIETKVLNYMPKSLKYNKVGVMPYSSVLLEIKTNYEHFQTSKRKGEQDSEDLYQQGRKIVRNIIKFNARSWYEWRINNWGTKWNASDTYTDAYSPDVVYFQTPWGPPVKAIIHLSKKYPDRDIVLKFQNEDSIDSIGKLTFKDGLMVKEKYPGLDTQEGLELLMELDGDYYIGRNEDGTLYFEDPDEE